jgi:hypothetical protein
MARDTLPSPPFDLAYLAKALKCAGLGEVGYFILFTAGGIPDNTIFSLFVKVGICSVRNTGIYICLFPMPDEVKHVRSVTLQMSRRGLQFLRTHLMGFEPGVGARISLPGRPARIRFNQLRTYPDHGRTS